MTKLDPPKDRSMAILVGCVVVMIVLALWKIDKLLAALAQHFNN